MYHVVNLSISPLSIRQWSYKQNALDDAAEMRDHWPNDRIVVMTDGQLERYQRKVRQSDYDRRH